MKFTGNYIGLAVAAVIYLALLSVRMTIPDSDLTRVVEEFSTIGMSDYNWREPLYWAVGKVLTAATGDAWLAILALDMASLAMVVLATRKRGIPGFAIVCLMLSPMILLGVCNIHRQLVAFSVWLLIERETEDGRQPRSAILHIVPFLIHNSMGILSFVYFFVQAIDRRNYFIIYSLAGIAIIANFIFGSYLADLFRQGTDTNTSVAIYFGWSLIVFIILVIALGLKHILNLLYALLIFVSILLFLFSGGSSGSRFFMLAITVVATWLFGHSALRDGSFKARILSYCLGLALVLPTFGSDFSREILRAAYFQIPYGTTY